jgi:hypothetical protein
MGDSTQQTNTVVTSNTHREYDEDNRLIKEYFENDYQILEDRYFYENGWIIHEQKCTFKLENRGFVNLERYKEDGSEWMQKFFDLETGRLKSEMRQIESDSGIVWHEMDYNEDGTISRSMHTNRPVEGGILEQTIQDGKIVSYTLIRREEM